MLCQCYFSLVLWQSPDTPVLSCLCALFHVLSCLVLSFAVWHAACDYTSCVLSCCHVMCEHVACEFSLAACSCLVKCEHMAGDLFYWLCAYVFVMFGVSTWLVKFPCAMCSPVDCLAPPILLPDYWFICPTCPPSLPPLFVLPIYSLCVCSLVLFRRRMYLLCPA